ncbi:hypothetical protein QWY99_19840 [Flavobacterium branchiarum]|uniref:Uncharacterized protein n=1 Tax=Flavobacterium branchiarum TaxID=1114870 RepID=A0ABV5FG13_9FLAO|nr:hypothetical protein [Flavobacterium branchiarum]MDN3675288.1 hypothetical protein [Flavobacterium branchiarum]
MNNKSPQSKYIPFIERLDIFMILIYFGQLILATMFIAFSSYEIAMTIGKAMTSLYVIFLIGFCFLLLSLYAIIKAFRSAIIFINDVEINSKTITLRGYKYNAKWEVVLNTKKIDICIKEQTRYRRNSVYYLEFLDEDDSKYYLNTSIYWSYEEILNVYNEIRKVK